ncbi:hypothetical protein D1007_17122 [Hordeum vulgare]|nr:hypothetical protein D1007_17122 [Hordeum vulgare]
MADARRVHAERRTSRIAQTVPIGAASARPSPSPMVNDATGTEAQEKYGSSQPATDVIDGHTATSSLTRPSGSASRARPQMPQGRRALAMATELLHYRPTPDRHEDWLHRIKELISTADDSTALSCSLQPQQSLTNNKEQDTPHPSPRGVTNPEPGHEARPRARPRERMAWHGDEASCEMIPRPRADACTPRRCRSRVRSAPRSKKIL